MERYVVRFEDLGSGDRGQQLIAAESSEEARSRFYISNAGTVIKDVTVFIRVGTRTWDAIDQKAEAEATAMGIFRRNFRFRTDGPSRRKCHAPRGSMLKKPRNPRRKVAAIFSRVVSADLFK